MQKYRYISQMKFICLYILRARTFRTRRKSLRARYVDTYERARNFLRSENPNEKPFSS